MLRWLRILGRPGETCVQTKPQYTAPKRSRGLIKRWQVESFAVVLSRLLGNPSRRLHVVDFGCGTGTLLLPLAARFPHCHFTGVEMKPAAVALLLERARAAGLSNVAAVRGMIEEFTDQHFDVALALHACGNATDAAMQLAVRRRAAYVVSPCCVGKLKFSLAGGSSFSASVLAYTPCLPGDRPPARRQPPRQPVSAASAAATAAAAAAAGVGGGGNGDNGINTSTTTGSRVSSPSRAADALIAGNMAENANNNNNNSSTNNNNNYSGGRAIGPPAAAAAAAAATADAPALSVPADPPAAAAAAAGGDVSLLAGPGPEVVEEEVAGPGVSPSGAAGHKGEEPRAFPEEKKKEKEMEEEGEDMEQSDLRSTSGGSPGATLREDGAAAVGRVVLGPVRHPRSAWLRTQLPDPEAHFRIMAKVADQNHAASAGEAAESTDGLVSVAVAAARACKAHVELDRNLAAKEEGYQVGMFKCYHWQEMAKSDLLVGVPGERDEWAAVATSLENCCVL